MWVVVVRPYPSNHQPAHPSTHSLTYLPVHPGFCLLLCLTFEAGSLSVALSSLELPLSAGLKGMYCYVQPISWGLGTGPNYEAKLA